MPSPDMLLRALPGHPFLHSYRVLAKVFHDDTPLVDAIRPLMGGGQGTQPDDEMRLSVRMVFLGIFKT